MFGPDTSDTAPIPSSSAANTRRISKRLILKRGVSLALLGCASLLVWGFVLKVQDASDRIN